MAIAVVSSLPINMPGLPSEAASDDGAALDFSALLLGQLLPLAAQATGADAAQDAAPVVSLPDQDSLGKDDMEDAAAFVIPFLSLTQDSISLAQAGKTTEQSAGLSANPVDLPETLQKEQSLSAMLPGLGEKENAKADAKAEAMPIVPLKPDHISAKFAVKTEGQAASTDEAISAKTRPAEGTQAMLAVTTDQKMQTADVQHRVAGLALATPLKDAAWHNDFSQKIVWMANNDKHAAQLVLNPPELGKIEVSLNIDKHSATATFVSANSDVRESIETALPRLREMFAGVGIELGQTNVSSESFKGQEQANAQSSFVQSPEKHDGVILEGESVADMHQRQQIIPGNGMVDLFA